MKQVILRSLYVLALGLPLPACMTSISQGAYWSDSKDDSWMFLCLPRLWVYGGAGNDAACLLWEASRGHVGTTILCLLDLPFSLAAETVLLPLTICQQIASIGKPPRENREDEAPPEEAPEPEPAATSPGPSSSSRIPPSGSAP